MFIFSIEILQGEFFIIKSLIELKYIELQLNLFLFYIN